MMRGLFSLLIGTAVAATCAIPLYAAGESTGRPDLSGVWVRQNDPDFYPVPGDEEDGKPLTKIHTGDPDDEDIIAGDWRNPILQPWSRAVVKENAMTELSMGHVFQADDACWPVAVPQILNLREAVQILQNKDRVTILYQRDHQFRRIWLNRAHPAHVTPSWYGDSVGHYEGTTLVVDTIGIRPGKFSFVDNYSTPHTAALHTVERYRPITDEKGKGIEFILTVEDPGTFTQPWKATGLYRPNRGGFAEVVCAENNRDFEGHEYGNMPIDKNPAF
jgi:hypothetical protein